MTYSKFTACAPKAREETVEIAAESEATEETEGAETEAVEALEETEAGRAAATEKE